MILTICETLHRASHNLMADCDADKQQNELSQHHQNVVSIRGLETLKT